MASSLSGFRSFGPITAFAALLALVDASPAAACSCPRTSEPEVALESADIVFEGQPTEVETQQVDLGFGDYLGAKRFQFAVTRYHKGQLGPSLLIFTVDQGSACGRDYSLGEAHIIYARYTEQGLLTDFACSRSRPTSLADEDLTLLGTGVAPDASYREPDTTETVPNGSDLQPGIHRVPLVTHQSRSGCNSSVASDRSPRWRPLAPVLMLVALLATSRRRGSGPTSR